jgi:hypothetical protein
MHPGYRIYLATLLFIGVFGKVAAQQNTRSPYSLFGAGNMHFDGFSDNIALGHSGVAYRFESNFNFVNPASMSAMVHTAFNAGGFVEVGKFKTTTTVQSFSNAGFNYLSLGFPIKKLRSGMAIGILPVTDIGYNITNIKDSSGVSVRNEFEGSGGLSKLNFGIGTKVTKNISLGLNYAFMFGQIDEVSRKRYPGSRLYTSMADYNSVYLKGIKLDFGIQIHSDTNSKITHVFGAVISNTPHLKGYQDRFSYTYTEIFVGDEFVRDTIINQTGKAVKSTMPNHFSLSYSIGNHEKWQTTLGYTQTMWCNYRSIFGENNGFVNDNQISFGAFICSKPIYDKTVKNNKVTNYLKSIRYSVGYRNNSGFININGNKVAETGLSAGFGFPFTKMHKKVDGTRVTITSRLFLTGEYVMRGSTKNNLLREDFFKITIGLNLSDTWFNKRMYD